MIYRNQSNAWVNTEIFAHWFHTNFVPVVSKRLREIGVEPKAVLLLDNCSAHPNEDELVSSDGKIRAKFLPPNVTSLIQPMDQGVLRVFSQLKIVKSNRRTSLGEDSLDQLVRITVEGPPLSQWDATVFYRFMA